MDQVIEYNPAVCFQTLSISYLLLSYLLMSIFNPAMIKPIMHSFAVTISERLTLPIKRRIMR